MLNSSIYSKIKIIIIAKTDSILFALKKMDLINKKLLLVFDNDKFFGLLSIGDIQRAIIANIDLQSDISNILRSEFTFVTDLEPIEIIKEKMLKYRTECMPILNEEKDLVDVLFWEDVFSTKDKQNKTELKLPVVIMAGGKGKRLKPITNVIPKPLIPHSK